MMSTVERGGRQDGGGSQIGTTEGSMSGVKLSVSLPDNDTAFVDDSAQQTGVTSRSSVIHQTNALLRTASMEARYVSAWQEWAAGEDSGAWDEAIADGLGDASR